MFTSIFGANKIKFSSTKTTTSTVPTPGPTSTSTTTTTTTKKKEDKLRRQQLWRQELRLQLKHWQQEVMQFSMIIGWLCHGYFKLHYFKKWVKKKYVAFSILEMCFSKWRNIWGILSSNTMGLCDKRWPAQVCHNCYCTLNRIYFHPIGFVDICFKGTNFVLSR